MTLILMTEIHKIYFRTQNLLQRCRKWSGQAMAKVVTSTCRGKEMSSAADAMDSLSSDESLVQPLLVVVVVL